MGSRCDRRPRDTGHHIRKTHGTIQASRLFSVIVCPKIEIPNRVGACWSDPTPVVYLEGCA